MYRACIRSHRRIDGRLCFSKRAFGEVRWGFDERNPKKLGRILETTTRLSRGLKYMRNHKDTKATKAGRMNRGVFAARLCARGVFVVPLIPALRLRQNSN